MSAHPITIEHYRAVLAAVCRMHEHAQRFDWDEVTAVAREVSTLTDRLRGSDPACLPDAEAQRERIEILTRIVRMDGEIRQMRDPRLTRVDAMLGPNGLFARRSQSQPMDS